MKIFEKLMKPILIYYYCFKDNNTPSKPKKIILGSLIYLFLPIDLIPDFFGPLGYSDDLSVLVIALFSLKKHCTEEHKIKASNFIKKYHYRRRKL